MYKKIAFVFMVIAMAMCAMTGLEAAQAKEKSQKVVQVQLMNKSGKSVGQAVLTEKGDGVQIQLHVTGLTPGIHGIHFHETGKCEPPSFESAGEHFNPLKKEHGLDNPKGPHAGDMKNVFADADGKINLVMVSPRVTLAKGKKNSLLDENGTALIIHEKADDQKTNPSGNSGARVVCGVIK